MNSHDANVAAQHSPQALSPLAPKNPAPGMDRISNDSDPHQHGPVLPPGTGKLGMWLFLAALFMLFTASIVAYLVIRIKSTFITDAGSIKIPVIELGTIHLPLILWGSTLAMVASSITMHMALKAVRHNRLLLFKNMMLTTFGLAAVFLVMQTPGLYMLLSDHYAVMENQIHIYGLLFVLVLLHAAHILGGLGPLAISTFKAQKNVYTPEQHNPIDYLTMYWHFLDGVWLAMFGVFLILG